MVSLPYKVECKSTYVVFEVIAAFDCETAAAGYASECARALTKNHYRVKNRGKVIREFAPTPDPRNPHRGAVT